MAKLLIIDDEAGDSALLARLLRAKGHEAMCAATAGEALSHMRRSIPDLVLLDLTMPKVDGLDLLDAIAGDSRFFDVPVAVLSGRSDEASMSAAKKLGAREYILKGTDWEQMYDRIHAQLPQ